MAPLRQSSQLAIEIGIAIAIGLFPDYRKPMPMAIPMVPETETIPILCARFPFSLPLPIMCPEF
jgi:hypothetical protein